MWKIILLILKVLGWWIGICGGLASLYSIWPEISASAENIQFHKSLLATLSSREFILFAALTLPIVVLFVLVHLNLRARGNVSLQKFLRRLNPLVFGRICIQTHQLEHKHQDIVEYIRSHRKGINVFQDEGFKHLLYLYLLHCKYILDLSSGDDVAIHIKLFEHKKTDTCPRVPLKKAVLSAYVRAPSQRECKLAEQQKWPPRENEERFRIIRGASGLASRMIEHKDKYDKAHYRHCTGYNHVFSDPEHHFLGNNLPRMVKKKRFYNSSANYNKYYRSLGVFIIHQHLKFGEVVNHEPVWGLLVVDSYAIKVFEKFITKFLAGYMAHRLYDAFSYAEQMGAIKITPKEL